MVFDSRGPTEMMLVISCRLFFGMLLGFFVPGFLLHRLLTGRDDAGAACLISTVILFHLIFWIGELGIGISLGTVGIGLVLIAAGLGVCVGRQGFASRPITLRGPLRREEWLLLLPLVMTGLVLFLKATWYPEIICNDGFFRWQLLAGEIFRTGTFSYYPPLNPADFEHYYYAEGFPPIVSFIYFWLYALFGRPESLLHGIPAIVQYLLILWYGYRVAERLFPNRTAGLMTLLLLGSSTLLFYSVMLTFETGLTALSLLALSYYLLREERPGKADLALAAFATAIGALTREYGGIFVFAGIVIGLWRRLSWRDLVWYLTICAPLIIPWYFRVWWLTGNPFYSYPVSSLFPVNPVHSGIMNGYRETIGVGSYFAWDRLGAVIPGLAYILGLPVLLGLGMAVIAWRKMGHFLITATMFFALWLYAIVAPQGLFHSMRILSPAIALLGVCGAWPLGTLASRNRLAHAVVLVVLVCANLIALLQNLFIPCNPWRFSLSRWPETLKLVWQYQGQSPDEVLAFTEFLPEQARVLSDNPVVHGMLISNYQSGHKLRLVPVWSPEVRFLFDPEVAFADGAVRLQELGINYVLIQRQGNLNFNYLNRFPFFQKYDAEAKLLHRDEYVDLYALPEVLPAIPNTAGAGRGDRAGTTRQAAGPN